MTVKPSITVPQRVQQYLDDPNIDTEDVDVVAGLMNQVTGVMTKAALYRIQSENLAVIEEYQRFDELMDELGVTDEQTRATIWESYFDG